MAVALLGLTFCACSDDDDEAGGGSSASISIPASVVDGVRESEMTGSCALNVTYNDDGTIAKAKTNGCDFVFEYEPATRGTVATGKAIKQIVASYTDNDNGTKYSYVASGFSFNTDGFLTKFHEESVEESSYGSDHFKETVKYDATMSYNAKGRLQSITVNGSWNSVETVDGETEKESGSGKGSLKFSYKGDVLEKTSITSDGETSEFVFGYNSTSPSNYYNIVTPQMAEAMSFGSPVLRILAMTGYLGNASATLPSTYQIIYTNDEESENEVDTYNIVYNMWDNTQRVKDIKMYEAESGYQVYYASFNYSIR